MDVEETLRVLGNGALRFVQITSAGTHLFGLTSDGIVYTHYGWDGGWQRMPMHEHKT